jgi:hypothetical protein
MSEPSYALFGQRLSTEEFETFLRHVFARNDALEAAGRKKTPVCIWGLHGIGKTETVEQTGAT